MKIKLCKNKISASLKIKHYSMDNVTTTNISSDKECNHLLNAIKNKFQDNDNSNKSSFNPPKLNIPLLHLPEVKNSVNNDNSVTQTSYSNVATQLNQFLLKQLQERQHNNDLNTDRSGFVLPKLSINYHTTEVKLQLPVLKSQIPGTNIGTITTAIDKLHLQENACKDVIKLVPPSAPSIDLTTALAVKFDTHQNTPTTRHLIKPCENKDDLDFEIPFIECDRLDISRRHKILLPTSNEYCVTDVSHLLLQHSISEPSPIGRFLSMDGPKYLDPLPLQILAPQFRQQKAKHCIEPFHFNTKSPDDLVLLTLSKYHRIHYN